MKDIIQKASKKNLPEINRIFIEEYSKPPYNEKWPVEKSLAKLKRYLKEGSIFVFKKDNKIVGFIIGSVHLWDKGDEGFINEVVVSKKFQGGGYGKKLITYFIKDSKKKGAIYVALLSNPRSKAFKIYKKMGFKILKDFTYMTKKIK